MLRVSLGGYGPYCRQCETGYDIWRGILDRVVGEVLLFPICRFRERADIARAFLPRCR